MQPRPVIQGPDRQGNKVPASKQAASQPLIHPFVRPLVLSQLPGPASHHRIDTGPLG